MHADRIVIPICLQQDKLSCIHQGYQGIVKYRLRARTSVWWPGTNLFELKGVISFVGRLCTFQDI